MSFTIGRVTARVYTGPKIDLEATRNKLRDAFGEIGALETKKTGLVSSRSAGESVADDPNSLINNQYFFFDVRSDTKTPNGRLVKAELEKWIQERRRNGQRVDKAARNEELSRIKTRELAKTTPRTRLTPCMIVKSGSDSVLYVGVASSRAADDVISVIGAAIDANPRSVTFFDWACAWAKANSGDPAARLGGLEPGSFRTVPAASERDVTKMTPADGARLYGFLGAEWMTWLYFSVGKEIGGGWKVSSCLRLAVARPGTFNMKLSGGDFSSGGFVEHAVAEEGGQVTQALFEFEDQNGNKWTATMSADAVGAGSLKIPGGRGRSFDAGVRMERAELVGDFFKAMQASFGEFLTRRTDTEKWKSEIAAIDSARSQ